jgi:TRAP-type C4-dicarboxylate transport system permease small subunit
MRHVERYAAMAFGFAFLGLALAVAVETFMRKVFNKSLQGVDELGGYVLAVGAGLSFAVALASRAHIRIDVIHDLLPRLLRIALNVIATLALMVCALAAFYMAWIAFTDTIQFSATAQTPWATPLKYPQGLWVAALAAFVVLAIVEVVRVFSLLLRGQGAAIDRSYGPRGAKDELAEELADLKARGVVIVDANAKDVRP